MSASTARQSLVRAAEDGERRWFFGGGLHIWKATAEETDGAFLLFEDRMDHGKVTPLHTPPRLRRDDVSCWRARSCMHLDGRSTRSAPAASPSPRAASRTPSVFVADGARLLCLHTPGCCQAFYWDASEPWPRAPPHRGPVDFSRVHASAREERRNDRAGPPPFAAGS